MKTKTITVREGELLGPIDPNYDYISHDWHHGGCGNPSCVSEGWKLIQEVKEGDTVSISYTEVDKTVLAVGMYDGWPYWKPTPAVYLSGTLGGEWHFFMDIRRIVKRATPPEPTNAND